MIIMDVDIEYEFDLEPKTEDDFRITKPIVEWVHDNLENLNVFSKVNYGYNEDTIKGFGKKPVADVYINNISYGSDLLENSPDSVTTFIICYLKGNMNKTYLKACELTDYLIQEFEDNPDFRKLTLTTDEGTLNIVRDTYIRNVELQIIPGNKTYGVLCAFELEHVLIK